MCFVVYLLAIAFLLVTVGSASAASFPVTIKDARGKSVKIAKQPRRIVALAPNITETLYALGLEKNIVGVNAWSDYPPAAKKKTKVGDMRINVEKVLSLKPDLIIAHGKLNDAELRQFENLGNTVISVDPKTLKQVGESISLIGRACGAQNKATAIARQLSTQAEKARKAAAGSRKVRTLVIIQPNPLWVAGPRTFVDEMLKICNAENVASDARSGFNIFPIERALARDPQVIVVGRAEERDFFLKSPVWRNCSAVKNKKVKVVNPDLIVRPGPRLSAGIKALDTAIHEK